MSTKMLIDASHPEETRVAVLKGNRVEEFDFESQNRKQLRGNIYLAKVTRVEPSLQAAFIEYGGNRHGFLAFSEIHPDYYQIPLADRQALLREDAAQAERDDEAAEEEEAADVEASTEDEEEAAPKPRRRRSRRSKSSDANEGPDNEGPDEEGSPSTMAAENESDSVSEPAAGEPAEKPKRRRTTWRKAKADEGPASEAASAQTTSEATEEAPKPKRRTRKKKAEETPSEPEADAAQEAAPDAEQEKPKRRSRRKAPVSESDGEAEGSRTTGDGEAAAEAAPQTEDAAKPKRRARRRKNTNDAEELAAAAQEVAAEGSGATADEADATEEPAAKPKRVRRSRSRKVKDEAESRDNEAEDDASDSEVGEVGSADALEEVPVRKAKRRHYKIQEVIKRRQIMLVQVVKEERGNKGAALTTYLSLAGRYSVLMPNTARGGGISRKITSAVDRKKLKEIAASLEVADGMGVILRTAGADRSRQEITRDFEYLLRLWENVRTLTLESTAPCLVYEEGSLIKRSIRDLFDKDTKEIWVAGREGYEEARDFMEMLEPEQLRNVRFYDERVPLFAKMGVESQLDHMLQPQVTLKSGGYLVINQTEALVAIDVNSGKSTRQHSIEDTAYQTNLEAADEVARQLRLRDLAGLIVIDFIDMDERRNNRNVEKRLKEALKNDRARIQVGRISHFGLLEMSRQRMRASVIESATETCPVCAGLGYVRSPSSVSIHVLRAMEEHLLKHGRNDITVRTRQQTALYILNQKRTSIDDLETRFGVAITFEADETLGQTHYTIEKGAPSNRKPALERHVQVDSIQRDDKDEEPESQDSPAVASSAAADEQGEGENGSGKRRRRGRRGGRKPKDGAEGSEEAVIADAPGDANDAVAQPSADGEENDEPAPRKRTRRRSAKAEPEVAEAASNGAADEAPAQDEEAIERPKRRSTARPRRKKAEEAIAETAIHSTADAVLNGEAGRTIEPAPESGEAAPEEPPRPPRRRTSRAGRERSNESSEGAATETSAPVEEPEKKGWLKRTFFPD